MNRKKFMQTFKDKSIKIEFFIKWEMLLLYIFIIFNLFFIFNNPYYLSSRSIFEASFIFIEQGIVALIMTFIIITKNIDISVASIMSLSSVSMAYLFKSGLNIWVSVIIGLTIGLLCGMINGVIITKLNMPSIIVTLGTYSLYRGISYAIMGDKAVTGFPSSFSYIGQGYIGGMIPFSLIVFIIFFILASLILHKTFFGRKVYAIGSNVQVAFASGILVKKIQLILFSISGFISGLAGILLTSRIGNTRPSIALGFEFVIITIVILGGISFSGGVGNMLGVMFSLILIASIRYGLGLYNITGEMMLVVTGSLLIGSILLNNILKNILSKKLLKIHK